MDLVKPKGCKDYLPYEAKVLREIERILTFVFESWGYEEIIPPTFEYYEFLTEGLGRDYKKKVYKLIDREGEILSLRPELTKPTGRIALTHLLEEPRPLKLFYKGMVFCREDPVEFPQIGIEIFGDDSICADVEVVSLAIESLRSIGIESPIVDLNHMKLIDGILDSLDERYRELIKRTLASKNLVLYKETIAFMDLPEKQKGFLSRLPLLRCDRDTFEKLRIPFESPLIEEAMEEIKSLLENVEFEGITVDLGMIRAFEYYNGIIFELSNPKEGKVFGGGGRYDKLFGIPAVGFALSLKYLPAIEIKSGVDVIIKVSDKNRDLKDAMRISKFLRERGFKTLVIPPTADEGAFIKRKSPKLFLKLEGKPIDEGKLIHCLTNGETT